MVHSVQSCLPCMALAHVLAMLEPCHASWRCHGGHMDVVLCLCVVIAIVPYTPLSSSCYIWPSGTPCQHQIPLLCFISQCLPFESQPHAVSEVAPEPTRQVFSTCRCSGSIASTVLVRRVLGHVFERQNRGRWLRCRKFGPDRAAGYH